jgi:hypothetical protein
VPERDAEAESLRIGDFSLGTVTEALDEGRGEKLVLAFTETDESLVGVLRYSPLRFARRTIDAFWRDMRTLLATTVATPEAAAAPLPRSDWDGSTQR